MTREQLDQAITDTRARLEALVALRQDQEMQAWLASYPRRTEVSFLPGYDSNPEARKERLFKEAIYDLELLKDEYGYDEVYLGVGCMVFPDAVNPFKGNDH